MAKKAKKNKKKAKKASKAARPRAGKKAAAKNKRGVKKAKKVAKNSSKAATKKAAKKAPKKIAKKAAKKAAKKSVAKKTVAPKKGSTVDRTSSAEKAPKAVAPRAVAPKVAKPAAAPKPAPAPVAERNTYFITTAIAYPNGQPHIGHAYEAIATDALARFQRLDGKDVFFLTGTDEHGLKMVQTAADRRHDGLRTSPPATPARFKRNGRAIERRRSTVSSAPRSLNIIARFRSIWNRMQQAGDIYIDAYSGWYSVRDEAYYAEDETIVGEDQGAARAAGHACRVGRGEELLLQTIRLSGQTAGALRRISRISSGRIHAATKSSAS